MPPLAWRNLFHDKLRLAVTLTGIVFALVLIIVESGLFIGFSETTSCLIDHSRVDLWVTSRNVSYFDLATPLPERRLYQVKRVPGVSNAEKYIVHWARWNCPDHQQEIQIVGFNPDSGMAGPWNLVQGSVQDLKTPDGVIVDDFYKKKLGVSGIGEVFEVSGHRARVVGFSHGIRAFTTSPYVFTAFRHAQDYALMKEDQTSYITVKLERGADIEEVRANILANVKDVDVLTGPEFSRKTQRYWTFTTGAGIALLLAAVLGLAVGFVVVAQTIYATTMDHLKEFGTLKAMGASNAYVCGVILTQALIGAVMGYAMGIIISSCVVHVAQPAGAPILMNWWMALGSFFLTLLMCSAAALISINRVIRLDPATVFKG